MAAGFLERGRATRWSPSLGLLLFTCRRFTVNNSTLSIYCKHLLRRHPGFIRTSFGRHEITSAAYIGFPTVTAVTLAIGSHRQVYVGYARVRQGRQGFIVSPRVVMRPLWTSCTLPYCTVPYRTVPYRTVPYRTVVQSPAPPPQPLRYGGVLAAPCPPH